MNTQAQQRQIIRQFFDQALARELLVPEPKELSAVEKRITRFAENYALVMQKHYADLQQAPIKAYDATVEQAARVCHLTDPNAVMSVMRRACIVYRNGRLTVH